jgi:lipid-binding SYLF domain-containing protein
MVVAHLVHAREGEERKMMHLTRTTVTMVIAFAIACVSGTASAESAAEIDRKAIAALDHLYATTPAAKTLGGEAAGILVFPEIGKAGFLIAAEFGVGALRKGGATAGYYNIAEVSAGYQAGVEKFSYALFFMTEKALAYLDKSGGFQLGAGPSLTVVDEGFAKSFTTTTARDDVYAFSFGAQGLMGGMGLKGSKITRFHPE